MKNFLVSLTALVILGACGQGTESKESIGLVVSTLNNPFFVELQEGAVAKAEEAGYKIVTLDSQNDTAKELANIEDLISRQVSVILVNPVDSDSSARAAQLAIKAGIPVISLDRNLNNTATISHIASDNKAGGKMAAQLVGELLADGEEVLVLEGIPGTTAANDRGQGFTEEAKVLGLNIIAKQTANFDRSQGLSVTENLLQVYPNAKAIFAHNDEMALGAQRAVADAGKEIIIIGFDATPDAVQAVSDKIITATIAQQPKLIGSKGVENAIKTILKEDISANVPIELKLVK